MTFPVHLKDKPDLSYADFIEFVAEKAANDELIKNTDNLGFGSWKNCAVGSYLKSRRPKSKMSDNHKIQCIEVITLLMMIDMPFDVYREISMSTHRTYADLHAYLVQHNEPKEWTHTELVYETSFNYN